MIRSRRSVGSAARSRGVSLIELMVSLVIGLLLVGGAVTVYTQSRATYSTTESAARIQEVGRYAMSVIEPDVRLAGFWGLTNRNDLVENTVADGSVGTNCGTGWIGKALPIDEVDGTNTGFAPSCTLKSRKANSDILIVRRADSRVVAPDGNKIQIQSNRVRAVIFKSATIPSGFTASSSETRDLISDMYYISQPAGTVPTLRRIHLVNAAMADDEVVPGIDDMQVRIGVDTNNDGKADKYVEAVAVGGQRVVAVRVWLRVIAEDRDPDYRDKTAYNYANASFTAANDDKRRVVFTKTIQLRNSKP